MHVEANNNTHTCRVSVTDSDGKGQCTTGRELIIVLTQCSGVTCLCPAKCQSKEEVRGERCGGGVEGEGRVSKRKCRKGNETDSRKKLIYQSGSARFNFEMC